MSFEFYNLRPDHTMSEAYEQFAQAVQKGLSMKPKHLPSWLIFDDEGSEIFTEITRLDGYHPARCEIEILEEYKNMIMSLLEGDTFRVIELGAGDGGKTEILLEHFIGHGLVFDYVPIDISIGATKNLVESLELKYLTSRMSVKGFAADYFDGLNAVNEAPSHRNFVLFLGSTIGNMKLQDAEKFVRKLWESLNNHDYVMIGFDLMKDPKVLYSAYNDSTGIFEKFNLHLLDVINEKLGGDFSKENYVQQGQYNPKTHAVESYIYSTREQVVSIDALRKKISFCMWESMQTEHSYKYTESEICTLAESNGYEIVRNLFDAENQFVDSIWKVKK